MLQINFYNLLILIIVWSIIWTLLIVKRYFQELKAYWQEPVLKYPVLIFESDDWGAGPLEQSQALIDIGAVLGQYRDSSKHYPVMTLGVVLSVPDVDKIKKSDFKNYHAKQLDHSDFLLIKTAMLHGLEQGFFDLQLHGMAHYWPDNLMRELQLNIKLREWLSSDKFSRTETLPSGLQSRWINTEQLPTTPLTQNEIDTAVKEEVNIFANVLGFNPKVVVPPTFIWNEIVETSWKKQGINYLITPGQCFEQRDSEGKPSGNGQSIVNGQVSKSGLIYLVRNDYFEPSLGQTAEMAIKALEIKTQLAQSTLLEIHRFNFIQNDKLTKNALYELDHVLAKACEKYPDIVFLSSKELAEKYASCDKDYVQTSYFIRLLVYMERVWANNSIRKWLYISGLCIPILCLKNLRN
ncbi:MAG: hypothetical protein P1P78_03220 [Methyloprofundus sp.]|nr:hypothetical protein [Methyloprofundus sp.]